MPPTIRIARPSGFKRLTQVSMTISGTVKRGGSGEPLSRTVLCYRNGETTSLHATTVSDGVTGAFSLTVNGNHNDDFKLEAIGLQDENSAIYDHVRKPA